MSADRVPVIAIDGPAGAGKSTIARLTASRLGIDYLDTGAMYRAVTALALQNKVSLDDSSGVAQLAENCRLELTSDRVSIDGVDVTVEIRSAPVTAAVSRVAANPGVRAAMGTHQRAWGIRNKGAVLEGRDIGTVIFPDAALKVFLTASPRVRAQRRAAETGEDVDVIEQSIIERDRHDSTRATSPLAEANDAVFIDTSDLSIDEVVDRIVALFTERTR